MTLYTIVFKLVSSQPDIPWGILKTKGPLSQENLSDSLYIDGYDLAPFGPSRRKSERAKWETPSPTLLTHESSSRPYSKLRDLSLEEMREILPKVFLNDPENTWENDYMIPYLITFFEVEAEREAQGGRKND